MNHPLPTRCDYRDQAEVRLFDGYVFDSTTVDEMEDWLRWDGCQLTQRIALDASFNERIEQLSAEAAALVSELEDDERLGIEARRDKQHRVFELLAQIKRRKDTPYTVRILQNRDRSSQASIMQVAKIAARPKGELLGFSMIPDSGAPMVFSDFDDLSVPSAQLGIESEVHFISTNEEIPVRYALLEADDILVSHDAQGSVQAGYGDDEAPGKFRAVIGNARSAGIMAAYAKGSADAYLKGIEKQADMLKIDPDVLRGMRKPILVRLMRYADVSPDIGDKGNSTGMAALSATEQAGNDAQRIDLGQLEFNDNGTPTEDTLKAFINAMPAAEQALLAPDGSPTSQAQDRLMTAAFKRAFEDDVLVKLYAQALDPEVKLLLSAMASAAGDMAALAGTGEYDIRQFVTQAANMAVNAKRQGRPLAEMARQVDLETDEEARLLAVALAAHSRSGRRMGDMLKNMARAAKNEAERPDEDMFGTVEKTPVADLMKSALRAFDASTHPSS